MEGCQKVGLFGLGREPGGGATSLDVDDNAGDFGHPGEPQSLAHKTEAGSCGGSHSLLTCVTRSYYRIYGLDFRAGLIGELIVSDQVVLHEHQNRSSRRDGISDEAV